MLRNSPKGVRKKSILLIAILLNILVLFLLIIIFLADRRESFSPVPCDNKILPESCPDEVVSEFDNSELDNVVETPLSDGNISLVVQPKLIDTYLSNPGIGWQHDINESSQYLPETVAYSNRKEIAWNILNPFEDVYDWTALDNQLSLAASSGKQFSFRVYTMAGEAYGGHKVPTWVLNKGAKIFPNGEPDYSNCVYQDEWGKFVQELIKRYDGNPNIAFIDISGYGNFNEWSWRDNQTQWDDLWDSSYANQAAGAFAMTTIDSQARRRLVDMFIGGVFEQHRCRDKDGNDQIVSYGYEGFKSTQLIMPYAGIVQSTQYVVTRRPDVGFRHDSLGRTNNLDVEKVKNEISQIWKNAPIIYEFSKPDEFDIESASDLLSSTHPSLVHNNESRQSKANLQKLISNVGYHYFLNYAQFEIDPVPKGKVEVYMNWQNVGSAPSYPKMGQNFELHLQITNKFKVVVMDYVIPTAIPSWMPAETSSVLPPENEIQQTVILPEALPSGAYTLSVSIIDSTTGQPINLSFSGNDGSGNYILAKFTVPENK